MVNYFNSKSYKTKNNQLKDSKEFEDKINNTSIYDLFNGRSKNNTWRLDNRLYAFDKILSKENLDSDAKKYIINGLGKKIKRKNDSQLNNQYDKLVKKYITNEEFGQHYDPIFNKKENLEEKTNTIEIKQNNPSFKKTLGYNFRKAAIYLVTLGTILSPSLSGCKDYKNLEKDAKTIIHKIYSNPKTVNNPSIEKSKDTKYIDLKELIKQKSNFYTANPKKINSDKKISKKEILKAKEVYKLQKIDNKYIYITGETEEAKEKIKESLKNNGSGILNNIAKDYQINSPKFWPVKETKSSDKSLTKIIEQNFKNLGKDIKSYYKDNRDYYPGGNPKKTISIKDSSKTVLGNIKAFFDNLFYNGSDIRSEKENKVYKNAAIGGSDILGITTQSNYEGIKQNLIGGGETKNTVKESAKSGLDKISNGVIKTWIKNLNPLNKDEFILLHPIKTAADALMTVPNLVIGATEIITSPAQAIPKTDVNGILNNIYDIPKHPIKNAVGTLPNATTNLVKTILKAPASLGKNGFNRETKYHKIINEIFAPVQSIETALARNNPETNVIGDNFLHVGGSSIDNLISNIQPISDKESYLYSSLGIINNTTVSALSNKILKDYMQDKDNGSLFFLLPHEKHEKSVIIPQKEEEQKPTSNDEGNTGYENEGGDNGGSNNNENNPSDNNGDNGGDNGNDDDDDNPPEQPPEQFDDNEENDPVDADGDNDYDYHPEDYNW